MRMVVAGYADLVTVDGLKFHFAYNPGMYQGGVAGIGLQLEPELEPNRKAMEDMLSEIAEVVLKHRKNINEINDHSASGEKPRSI